jgi:hypothetical protein
VNFIWATRGRTWGFTFIAKAELRDPLSTYERAMSMLDGSIQGRAHGDGVVALKLIDPEGRRDRSGRPITHSFVLFGDLADRVGSVEDGIREVWPLVAAQYESAWDQPEAPSASD